MRSSNTAAATCTLAAAAIAASAFVLWRQRNTPHTSPTRLTDTAFVPDIYPSVGPIAEAATAYVRGYTIGWADATRQAGSR
jgi:hypothetical protein